MTTAAPASGIVQGAVPASRRPDGTLRKEIKVRPGFTPQEDVPRFRSPRVLKKLKGLASPAVPSPSPPATTIPTDTLSTASLASSLEAMNISPSSSIDSPSFKKGSSASMHAPQSTSAISSDLAPAPASTTGFKSGAAASMHAPAGKRTGSSASIYAPSSQPSASNLAAVHQDTSSHVSSAPSASASTSPSASITIPSSSSSRGPSSHSGPRERTDEPPCSPPRKTWPTRQITTQDSDSKDPVETKFEPKAESSSAEASTKTPEVVVSSSSPSKLAMDQPPSTFASDQPEFPPSTAYRPTRILDSGSNQGNRSARHNIDSDWNAAKHCFLDEDDFEDKRSRKGGRKGKNAKKGKGSSKTSSGKGAEAFGIPIVSSDRLGSNAVFVDGSELDEDLQKTFTPSPSLSRVLPPSLSKLDPSKAPFIFPSRPSTPIHSAGPSSPAAEERPNPVVNLPISAGLAEKKDKDREGSGVEGDSWRRRRTEEEDSLFGAGGKGPVDRIVVNLPKGKSGAGADGVAGAGPGPAKEGGAKDKKRKKKKKNAAKAKEDTSGGKGVRGKKEEESKATAEEQIKQKKNEQTKPERPTVLPSLSDDSWGVHLRTQSWADEIDLEEDEPNFG